MATILGIDVGTSSAKVMLFNPASGVLDIESKQYDVQIPQIGWAEQDPDIWWGAVSSALNSLRDRQPQDYSRIEAIGLSGQMHGFVALDANGDPLRPAIIWLDQRSGKQVDRLEREIGSQAIKEQLQNRIFPGFALVSLLWMQEHEPDIFAKIHTILSPKDYIRFRLTGKIGTDFTDASGTAAFNIRQRQWAWEIIDRLKIPESFFPVCHESTEIAGTILKTCAAQTGLREGIPVVYGSGDQQAQSIGNGAVKEGTIISNIGTGGQISAFLKKDVFDPQMRTHTFCHAVPDAYTIFGATLCGGMSLRWFENDVLSANDYKKADRDIARRIPAGSHGIIFLPYLSGVRTPYMNSKARGAFFGLHLEHDQKYLLRAIMEGVTFSLKDSLAVLQSVGIESKRIIASGGGASSPLWLQIQADIYEKEVLVCRVKEQACLGACILAGYGTGIFESIEEACRKHVIYDEKIYMPNPENQRVYRREYEIFQQLYGRTSDLMEQVNDL